MSLNYVTLTCDLYDGSGSVLNGGIASFTPTVQLTDATDHEIIPLAPVTAAFKPGGSPSVRLLATDNGNPLPAGWAWTVTFTGVPGSPASFSFFLPYSGGSAQNLSALSPVSSAVTQFPANPMTTAGDIIYGASSPAGTPARLGIGSSGQALVVSGGLPAWGSVATNPMTTAGDIITGGSAGAPQRLAVGSTGQVLTVSGGAPAWGSAGSGSVTSVSVATANGFAGTVANPTSTPAITVKTGVTGLLKGDGTGVSAAASGTDYAPATSGSAILKGNGSGGFSSAASGTDYAPATSGSSILKGNGSGGFSSASAGTDYLAPSGSGAALTGITASQVSALPSNDDLSAIATANATAGNVAMNSHKLTGLANGSASTDSAAYGQTLAGGSGSPMTTLGDILYENSTPAPARLAGNTTGTKNFLTQTGTGSASAAPAWGTIAAGDVPTLNQNTSGTAAGLSATLAIGSGGTGQTTAQAAMDALAGAVTSTQYLRGNGTHVVMAAIQAGDVPTLNQNTSGSSASCTGNAATATNLAGGATLPAYLAPHVATLSFVGSGTTLVDASLGNSFNLTLTASTTTLGAPSNAVDGEVIRFRITQGSGGNFTLAYASAYDFGTAGAPTLSTTAAKVDILGFEYVSSISKWCYLGSGLGF